MRTSRSLLAVALAVAGIAGAPALQRPDAEAQNLVGRSMTLAGRKVQCPNAEIMIDRDLPSEGGAGDTVILLNPDMLGQQPKTVRLFVFNHECGHISVGDSELDADCWAVERGVREQWLDAKGLKQVCDSFEGMPETSSHPSAARRCRNLDRCYRTALAALPKTPAPAPATAAAIPAVPVSKRAVLAQHLTQPKALSAWRCTEAAEPAAGAQDPIGDLIAKGEDRSQACR